MKNFFKLFLEALKGNENLDYTTIAINRAIFLLSVPMVIEMFAESLFAVVDIFFVSTVSVDAVATVGLTETVLSIIYSMAWGLSGGATAVVARRVGEGNPEAAGNATSQVIFISLVLSALVGIPGFIFAEDILRLMGATESVIATGVNFTRIIFASSPSIILLYSLGGALRGAGDASTAMRSLWVANLLNILLDILFIWVFKVGVVGAAIATTTGRTIGVLYQLYKLNSPNGNIKLNLRSIRPDMEVIKNIITVASGTTVQFIIASASWVFLARILSTFGSDVVAGYTVAIRVIIFTILPSWGMSNAAATLVGQNLGAGKPDRAEASVWRTSWYNVAFLVVVGIVFGVFAEPIIGFFNPNPKVIEVGTLCLRIVCLGYLAYGFGMVIGQSLNGAGDTLSPTIMNLICFWAIEIPLAYLLAKTLAWGPSGVFWSIAISETILALMAIWVFRRGRWKRVQL